MIKEMTVKIEAPAELMLLRSLNAFVRELIRQLPALERSDKVVDDLELVFNEAFANVNEHAYPSEDKGEVIIRIRLGSDFLEFRFEDTGRGFDLEGIDDPDFDDPQERGRGLWIMRSLMDEITYRPGEDGRNVLKLRKYLDYVDLRCHEA